MPGCFMNGHRPQGSLTGLHTRVSGIISAVAIRKEHMRTAILRRLVRRFRGLVRWRPYGDVHFSQEGEDVLLARVFSRQREGIYVDVGAHHPRRFSNTYWAYERGWHGLNIDAAPGFEGAFTRSRPRDTNIWACVSDMPGTREFRVFHEKALNTVDPDRALYISDVLNAECQIVNVPARRLDDLLDNHLPCGAGVIDFMSIDVEGAEMEVLRSNDWSRFKPRVIIVEVLHCTLSNIEAQPAVQFLVERGFTPVAMMYHSVFLVSDEQLLAEHWGTMP